MPKRQQWILQSYIDWVSINMLVRMWPELLMYHYMYQNHMPGQLLLKVRIEISLIRILDKGFSLQIYIYTLYKYCILQWNLDSEHFNKKV